MSDNLAMSTTHEVTLANYEASLRSFINSDEFAQVDNTKLGIAINGLNTEFKKAFGEQVNDEVFDEMIEISVKMLDKYKALAGIAPYVPTEKEMEVLYEPFYAARKSSPLHDAILNIESWSSRSLKKALDLRPADRHDFEAHLYKMELQYIREAAGSETGYLKDKVMRFTEGVASQPLRLLGTRVRERLSAEYIPEAPRYDQQSESQISFIFGAMTFYLLIIGVAVRAYKSYQSRSSRSIRGGAATST